MIIFLMTYIFMNLQLYSMEITNDRAKWINEDDRALLNALLSGSNSHEPKSVAVNDDGNRLFDVNNYSDVLFDTNSNAEQVESAVAGLQNLMRNHDAKAKCLLLRWYAERANDPLSRLQQKNNLFVTITGLLAQISPDDFLFMDKGKALAALGKLENVEQVKKFLANYDQNVISHYQNVLKKHKDGQGDLQTEEAVWILSKKADENNIGACYALFENLVWHELSKDEGLDYLKKAMALGIGEDNYSKFAGKAMRILKKLPKKDARVYEACGFFYYLKALDEDNCLKMRTELEKAEEEWTKIEFEHLPTDFKVFLCDSWYRLGLWSRFFGEIETPHAYFKQLESHMVSPPANYQMKKIAFDIGIAMSNSELVGTILQLSDKEKLTNSRSAFFLGALWESHQSVLVDHQLSFQRIEEGLFTLCDRLKDDISHRWILAYRLLKKYSSNEKKIETLRGKNCNKNHGMFYYAEGEYKKAINYFNQTRQKDDFCEFAYVGLSYLELKKPNLAFENFHKFLQAFPFKDCFDEEKSELLGYVIDKINTVSDEDYFIAKMLLALFDLRKYEHVKNQKLLDRCCNNLDQAWSNYSALSLQNERNPAANTLFQKIENFAKQSKMIEKLTEQSYHEPKIALRLASFYLFQVKYKPIFSDSPEEFLQQGIKHAKQAITLSANDKELRKSAEELLIVLLDQFKDLGDQDEDKEKNRKLQNQLYRDALQLCPLNDMIVTTVAKFYLEGKYELKGRNAVNQALQVLENASEIPSVCAALWHFYFYGRTRLACGASIPADPYKAIPYLLHAQKCTDPESMRKYAELLTEGVYGIQQDYKRALKIYEELLKMKSSGDDIAQIVDDCWQVAILHFRINDLGVQDIFDQFFEHTKIPQYASRAFVYLAHIKNVGIGNETRKGEVLDYLRRGFLAEEDCPSGEILDLIRWFGLADVVNELKTDKKHALCEKAQLLHCQLSYFEFQKPLLEYKHMCNEILRKVHWGQLNETNAKGKSQQIRAITQKKLIVQSKNYHLLFQELIKEVKDQNVCRSAYYMFAQLTLDLIRFQGKAKSDYKLFVQATAYIGKTVENYQSHDHATPGKIVGLYTQLYTLWELAKNEQWFGEQEIKKGDQLIQSVTKNAKKADMATFINNSTIMVRLNDS